MARTREYMDYLDEKIGIAPANSQEEYQASEIIADLMGQHGLETSVQEFDSHGSGTMVRDVLAIVLFVALLVGGILEGAPRVVLMLVALAMSGLMLFIQFVRNPFEEVGPAHRSQNVVGVRPAPNPDVANGSRPIVIVAHYDTPREAVLRKSGLARYQAMLVRVASYCPGVVAAAALFQMLGFLPDVFRMFMWVVGLIAALPVVILAVTSIMAGMGACTTGANDNKSGVAALLALMDRVSPAEDEAIVMASRPAHRKRREKSGMQEPESLIPIPEQIEVVEEVKGVRHGEEVLRALQILPPSCEITYEEPRVRVVDEVVQEEPESSFAEEESPEYDEDYGVAYDDGGYDEDVYADYEDDFDDYDDSLGEEDEEFDDYDNSPSHEPGENDETKVNETEDATREERDFEEEDDLEDAIETGAIRRALRLPSIAGDDQEEDENPASDGVEEDYVEDDTDDDYVDDEALDESDAEYDSYEDEFDDEYNDDYEEYDDELDDEYDDEQGSDEDEAPIGSSIGSWLSKRFQVLKDKLTFDDEDGEGDDWIDEDDQEDAEPTVDEEEEADDESDGVADDDSSVELEDEPDDDYSYELEEDSEEESGEELEEDDLEIEDELPEDETGDEGYDDFEEDELWEEDYDDDDFVYSEGYDEEYDGTFEFSDEEESDEDVDEDYLEEEVPEEELLEEDEDYFDDFAQGGEGEADEYEYEDDYEEEHVYDEDDVDAAADLAFEAEQAEYDSDFEYDEEDEYPEKDFFHRLRHRRRKQKLEREAQALQHEGAEAEQELEDETVLPDYYDDEPYYEEDAEEYIEEYTEDADEETYYEDEGEEDALYEGEYEGEYIEEYDGEYNEEPQERKLTLGERIRSLFRRRGAVEEQYADDYNEEEDGYLADEDGAYYEEEYTEFEGEEYESEDEYGEYDDEAYDDYSEEAVQQEPLPDPNRLHFDREQDDDILPRDSSGLDTFSDSYDLYSGEVERESRRARPAAVDDPMWGTSSYQPTRPGMSIARRAALYDLPDPSGATVDPLADDYAYEEQVTATQEDVRRYEAVQRQDISIESSPAAASAAVRESASQQESPRTGRSFWNDDRSRSQQASDWKGGATIRDDLRGEDVDFDGGDLQDAMLELGDEFLDEHDIWFVATGASEEGHAGMKAFLDAHRRDIRGAFLVNLECVGSGSLAVYAREGAANRKRADRRLLRMVTDIARDLHIKMDTAMCDWGETDAASALRARIRAVTIVGLDNADMPALSHTLDDVYENVNPDQVDDVVRIVTEVIRRS
ncbi:MAG: M28 family peptidase [Atopobiaceae bacterium]|nr:M28 family peptidase [Atopobiaceae bacterium]